MSLLLAKIALLMLVAAGLGGLVAWWLVRRQLQAMAAEQARHQADWALWRQQIDRRLDERPEPDWSPLMHRLTALEKAVSGIRLPTPEPTNLRPVLDAVASIRWPEVPKVNLEAVQARLLAIEESIRGTAQAASSLQPLMASLLELQRAVAAIRIAPATSVDLTPVLQQLALLQVATEAAGARKAPPAA